MRLSHAVGPDTPGVRSGRRPPRLPGAADVPMGRARPAPPVCFLMTFFRPLAVGIAALVAAPAALAQHTGHTTPSTPPATSTCTPEHAAMGHCTMPDSSARACAMEAGGPCPMHASMHGGHGGMTAATSPGAPMTRDGSGTSWNPDATPMEAAHGQIGRWHTMLHGTVFPRYTAQDLFESGTRGRSRLSAPNWLMGMAQRPVGRGALTVRAMVSADPLTEGAAGYPLLFQTGEALDGQPLLDEQHPHDLFSELSATFAQPVGARGSVFGYLAYPGEPAIGPTAFMHRPSARLLPDAPLSHHWQDATHIVFGVATLGASVGPVKVDGSVFTGREPDDERYGFDRPRFDSYSARLTWAPTANWAVQASRGWITSPEELHPDEDVTRTTASVLFARPTPTGDVSAALVWGYNDAHLHDGATGHAHAGGHAVLAEGTIARGAWGLFTRGEWVQKSGEDLQVGSAERFGIGSLTLGATRTLATVGGVRLMAGLAGTAYAVPEGLQAAYGKAPVSGQVFLRLAPASMNHGGGTDHGGMDHDGMDHGGM